MFLIDDILLSPVTGLLCIFRELHHAVEQDAVNEAEAIRAELSELYMLLETERITEAQADAREKELLDRLDELETRGQDSEEDEDDAEPPADETDPRAREGRPGPADEDAAGGS